MQARFRTTSHTPQAQAWTHTHTLALQHEDKQLGLARSICTVYLRHFWQGNHQIYGHIQWIYTILQTIQVWGGAVQTPLFHLTTTSSFVLFQLHHRGEARCALFGPHACICLWVCVHACICVCVSVYVCVQICVSVGLCVCVFAYLCPSEVTLLPFPSNSTTVHILCLTSAILMLDFCTSYASLLHILCLNSAILILDFCISYAWLLQTLCLAFAFNMLDFCISYAWLLQTLCLTSSQEIMPLLF